jgi:hypothetical protein
MGVDAAPAGLRSRASLTRGTPGLRPPATRSGCQELAEGAARSFALAEARSRGIYKRRGGTGVTRTPARVERREAWALIARRPPRFASVASAASRTRRHWMRLPALHVPSFFDGDGPASLGAFRPRERGRLFDIRIRKTESGNDLSLPGGEGGLRASRASRVGTVSRLPTRPRFARPPSPAGRDEEKRVTPTRCRCRWRD